jgi:hypothetical protein
VGDQSVKNIARPVRVYRVRDLAVPIEQPLPGARKITGTPWSGPLFFGLKQNQAKRRHGFQGAGLVGELSESGNAAD